MSREPNVAIVASLIADPARSSILMALLDGSARPAGELAYAAGITPQTASSHLAKLVAGGLLAVEAEGRHRYFRLAGPEVAQALESLAVIRPTGPVMRKVLSGEAERLRYARCCYDHLAGRLGVALTDVLQNRRFIVAAPGKAFHVMPAGHAWFASIGLDSRALRATPRGLARQCLDWTERKHHLAGPLGNELLRFMCRNGWLRRLQDSRAVQVTPNGLRAIRRHFDSDQVRLDDLESS